jgi:UDP-3-O-[3-hydroxymyristoyl] glucosamine N-acyltransferase
VSVTVRQLAELVDGKVLGDGDILIKTARSVGQAQPGEITFIETEKNLGSLHDSRASAAVVPPQVQANGKTLIQVKDPLASFVIIVRHLQGWTEAPVQGIDARASIHASARIGADASIFPLAVVGAGTTVGARCRIHSGVVVGSNCKLGDDVVLHPNCVLYDGVILGNRVIVHSNAVLGADGFGYRFHDGKHVKVPQLGYVEIGDDVEVGACTTIDRGTFQATRIDAGTKIDNLVQVGHNCHIGRHNLLVSQVGIAGSCTTGEYVIMAGQAGIVDHVDIGTGAVIGAKAGVTKDVPAGARMLGAPATPERDQKRALMSFEKLPDMRRDLRKIKQQLGIKDEE